MLFYAYWMLYMEAIIKHRKLDTTKHIVYPTKRWEGPEVLNWWSDK